MAAATAGLRWPSAATPKPPERSRYSPPSASTTRQPSASAQSTAREPRGDGSRPLTREKRYASASSQTQEARHSERECVLGDRGHRLATLCSRPEGGATLPGGSRLKALERVERDVAGDLRVLLQAPERVLVPLSSERNVDAQAVTLANELVADLGPNAEKHLEL